MTNEPEPNEHPTLRALRLGHLNIPLGTAARTDTAAGGEVAAYESGSTIVLQIASKSTPGTWRSVTLS